MEKGPGGGAGRGGGEILGSDTGGTFTDLVLLRDGALIILKKPSDPLDPARPLLEGAAELGLSSDAEVVHGSTVATNTLLERKGARTVLVTTRGFDDVIEIGRQARPLLYAFHQTRPEPLVPAELRLEVDERLDHLGRAITPLAPGAAEAIAARVAGLGAESVAVCFLHAHVNPEHERAIGAALERSGKSTRHVSLSSEVAPEHREYERTSTTAINAYVTPVVARHVERLQSGLGGRRLRVLQSNGGSISAAQAARGAARTVLSGPAAGVAGAHALARAAGHEDIITLDVGGTSTDVALCPGTPRESTETMVAGLPLRLPALDIHSIGAGGGSIARVDRGGALRVGPESAGARPGPACYGLGGSAPTVTDAHVVLGRIGPSGLLGGRMPLDRDAATHALESLGREVGCSAMEAARDVVLVAEAAMERAIRRISVERGHDPRRFTLVPFGGAGPLHACALADALGIRAVLVPRHPGVLCALGALASGVVKDHARGVIEPLAAGAAARVDALFAPLVDEASRSAREEGIRPEDLSLERRVDARYAGQSHEILVAYDGPDSTLRRFHAAHEERFGHSHDDLPVEITALRVRASSPGPDLGPGAPPPGRAPRSVRGPRAEREDIVAGDKILGPCAVDGFDATVWIADGWDGRADRRGNLLLERARPGSRT